jgi:hypothetical protein
MESSKSHFIFDDVGRMAIGSRRVVDNSNRSHRSSRHHRRGTVVRGLAISVIILIIAGCSPYYDTVPAPKVPPTVVGMEWTNAQSDYDADCAIGLTTDGLTFVAGMASPIFGSIAAEWVTYTITGSLTPVGAQVGDCWNALTRNSSQFAIYLQCFGEPYIKYWFDNWGEAVEWAAIPMCKCHIGCQEMSDGSVIALWKAEARRQQWEQYCLVNSWRDFLCGAPKPNGWLWGRHGVGQANMADSGGTEYPPPIPEGPLPSDWNEPWWDTTAPIPTSY